MNLNECLLNRRTIRNFTNSPVSDEMIRGIINAAIHAPSACNFAAWKFIVVTNTTPGKDKLRNPIALRAPYGILVTYRNDLYVTGRVLGDYIQSAAAAIQNMLLYITSVGLGGCWICGLPKVPVLRKAFNIPRNFDVIAYVAFGHPHVGNENSKAAMQYHYGTVQDFKVHKRRYSVDQVMCRDHFAVVDGDCTHTNYPRKPHLTKLRLMNFINRIRHKYHLYWNWERVSIPQSKKGMPIISPT